MSAGCGAETEPPEPPNDCSTASAQVGVERETGIEPASLAWKARVLPLNYSRTYGTSTVPVRPYSNPIKSFAGSPRSISRGPFADFGLRIGRDDNYGHGV